VTPKRVARLILESRHLVVEPIRLTWHPMFTWKWVTSVHMVRLLHKLRQPTRHDSKASKHENKFDTGLFLFKKTKIKKKIRERKPGARHHNKRQRGHRRPIVPCTHPVPDRPSARGLRSVCRFCWVQRQAAGGGMCARRATWMLAHPRQERGLACVRAVWLRLAVVRAAKLDLPQECCALSRCPFHWSMARRQNS
jgi:hypothetical protein